MTDEKLAIIVLAAGQGTRMKSATPKLLHEIAGMPLIGHVLATAGQLDAAYTVSVVRHERDRVVEVIEAVRVDAVGDLRAHGPDVRLETEATRSSRTTERGHYTGC